MDELLLGSDGSLLGSMTLTSDGLTQNRVSVISDVATVYSWFTHSEVVQEQNEWKFFLFFISLSFNVCI